MFCPKCATQNLDGASFCRSCGANISLVPQALSGQLVQYEQEDNSRAGRRARRRDKHPSLANAFRSIFSGIAFLIVAIAVGRSGASWWWALLFPAFFSMANGISQYISLKERERKQDLFAAPMTQSFPDRRSVPTPRNISAPGTGEMMPPVPSVTEGTTRHLGVEPPTRHFDAEQK